MVQAFTDPGDQVILQSPVYYPFYDVIRMNGRTIVDNPLVERIGKFEIDFALLEEQARNGAKLMLLCTPHNPGGRVWTREELIRVGEICLKYGVLVVADEIHHDLVFSDHKHTPFASISEAFAQQSMTCIATSKTFNLAGLQAGTVIIPNTELRRKYNYLLKTLSIHMETCFGQAAVISSYNSGDEWLDQLLPYLEANRDYIIDYLAVNLPQIRVMKPEGTYLIWLDCRAISDDPKVLRRIMFEDAGVAFSEGSVFGKQGTGWLRINFACPRSIVIEALDRFTEAVRKAKPL
jgi:cystathionine beta-lyase